MSPALRYPLLSIRGMCEADLPVVIQNEQAAHTHPWSAGIFQDCLKSGYYCQTLRLAEQMAGHAVLSTGAGEAHLLNLCIAPGWQGKGLGRRLLKRMLHLACSNGIDTLFLEVRITNRTAIALYESEGFCEIGKRNNYYPADQNNREDALVFARAIIQPCKA